MLEINLKNKAISQHTRNFNSMCKFGDTYLGATVSGLFRLGGYTDDGAQIPLLVTSGVMDFGSDRPKRVRLFYFGVKSLGNLKFTVTCDGDNAVEYVARIPDPDYRIVPVQVARGQVGRYWQWSVENVDGAFVAVYSVKALVVVL